VNYYLRAVSSGHVGVLVWREAKWQRVAFQATRAAGYGRNEAAA
jgi:hypothetical protein